MKRFLIIIAISICSCMAIYADFNSELRKAEQGDAEAQCNIGQCYFHGNDVVRNYTQAVDWYRRAAEQGNAEAQYHLGFCYYYGYGVAQDYTQAVSWFRKAAERGHAQAQETLGSYYSFGEVVAPDYAKAIYWFRQYAEQGYADGYNEIAIIYANLGNFTEAHHYINMAIVEEPNSAHYYNTKGEIYLMQNDIKNAQKMWYRVLELDPNYDDNMTPLCEYIRRLALERQRHELERLRQLAKPIVTEQE